VTTPFYFGLPTFGVAAVVSMIVVMLITAVETTGDVFATGEIVEKRIRREDVARAIRADGLATTIGGLLNSFPYTCFAENVGLVRLTRIKSRYVVAVAGLIMIVFGLLPKMGAIVAAVPRPVLGGAALVLFATVGVIGIQTLSRVDFHDERNVIIVAVSVGLALIPVAFPDFYQNFPDELQIIVGSGITMGSISAIVLNLVFNVLGGKRNLVDEVDPTPRHVEKISLDQVNHLSKDEFVERFGRLFQGPDWVAEEAWEQRPFRSLYDLRHAFQNALFEATPERQVELLQSYPDLGKMVGRDQAVTEFGIAAEEYEALSEASMGRVLGPESLRDQSSAGLDRLSPHEYEAFQKINDSYREKFGFPFIVCVREHTKETILENGRARLENPPAQERATALVEVAKIANLRLLDLVEEPLEEPLVAQRS
jgi:2-oxo-4-hydroxy-4-carboxy--5-ureidoimidazoline (OHCU) decarboxylase